MKFFIGRLFELIGRRILEKCILTCNVARIYIFFNYIDLILRSLF